MINKVILVGRLGKDPEIRSTPQGTTVAKFTVATDEKFTDRAGEKQERTEWHNVVAWGKLGEICGQYLRKGKLVYIEGSIRTDSWDDKESGQKKYRTEIVASTMATAPPTSARTEPTTWVMALKRSPSYMAEGYRGRGTGTAMGNARQETGTGDRGGSPVTCPPSPAF